ncbi:hypothetical protein J3458_005508 [Metarhizium acridum]|uniref:uncharacterized protein n=1 Tax=Metarhizium acridum TaxID=92637 RepID=UPI001C6C3FB7|nr:hypothetical protein J3458_005508 [Metarhizium acridum]
MLKEKPVTSYAEWRVAHLRGWLKGAAESPVIQGWRSNGLNIRIEKFLSHGGPDKVLADVDLRQKSIIHGDFSTNNMVFDRNTKKITALLNFDWSFISHPFDPFTESTDKWELAKAWNAAMKKNGVVSPSDMKGVDQIRDMLRLGALLNPFRLRNKSMLEQMSDEKKAELRATEEEELVHWLQRHGPSHVSTSATHGARRR